MVRVAFWLRHYYFLNDRDWMTDTSYIMGLCHPSKNVHNCAAWQLNCKDYGKKVQSKKERRILYTHQVLNRVEIWLAWDNTIYKLYAYLLFPSKTLHSNTLCILRHRTGSKVTLITFDPRGGRSPQEGISVNSEKICVFQQKSVKETFQTFLFLLTAKILNAKVGFHKSNHCTRQC